MGSFASGRNGLAVRFNSGDKVGSNDLDQMIDAACAERQVLLAILGGAGIYAGGAANLAALGSSHNTYPAVTIAFADGAGQVWFFQTTSVTAITFNATSGACSLYAVPVLIPGVTAAANGGAGQLTFVCQLTTAAAPANSFLLGAGNVTASAFTTWTPASTTPGTPLIGLPSGAVPSMRTVAGATLAANISAATIASALSSYFDAAGAAAAVTLASLGAVPTSRNVAGAPLSADISAATIASAVSGSFDASGAAAAMLTTANTWLARQILANNLNVTPNATLGPPSGGSPSVGDHYIDLAGALWRYMTLNAVTQWWQCTPGLMTFSGGQPTVGSWPASALDGYRCVDTATNLQWVYNYSLTRWRSAAIHHMAMTSAQNWAGYMSGNGPAVYGLPISSLYDLIPTRASCTVYINSPNGSGKYWQLDAYYSGSSSLGNQQLTGTGWQSFDFALTPTVYSQATNIFLYLALTASGSPGNCQLNGGTMDAYLVHK